MQENAATLEKILDKAKDLSVPEKRQLRDTVEMWLQDKTEAEPEQEFLQCLLEKGLMTRVNPPIQPQDDKPFPPVVVRGKPVSETVIEDRR